MIAICTCIGVPQRFSDFFAARYHLPRSSNMAQMFSTFFGAVAQLALTMATSPTSSNVDRVLPENAYVAFEPIASENIVMIHLTILE
jgi:hypothetical protein